MSIGDLGRRNQGNSVETIIWLYYLLDLIMSGALLIVTIRLAAI